MKKIILADSGQRRTFDSGAQRDREAGKGAHFLLPVFGIEQLAQVFEVGAAKYESRNWERGMPLSEFASSGIRHALKTAHNVQDGENHPAQAAWNFVCYCHLLRMIELGQLDKVYDDRPPPIWPTKTHKISCVEPYQIYVAGPITAKSADERANNYVLADEIAIMLACRGHDVHCPHSATRNWEDRVPYEQIMRHDLRLIEKWATALYFIAPSPGANRERKAAEQKGIPIFERIEDVPDLRENQGTQAGLGSSGASTS